MAWLSHWQWERYKAKLLLVETYRQNSVADATPFPVDNPVAFQALLNEKVVIRGRYDYTHQVIVTNKKHGTSDFSAIPGHFLLTPLLINGTNQAVIVSRGFIPFEDLTQETWQKYDFEPAEETLVGVLKKGIRPMFLGPKNPPVGNSAPFQRKFFYEEIEKLAKQLPYPTIDSVYIQRLGAPPHGTYPAEAVSIEVPPSTHRGYTFEWAALALCTLGIGFLLQAFPQYRRPFGAPQAFGLGLKDRIT